MSRSIGIVGFGKIARDQHVNAIAETEGLHLAAIASRNARLDGVDCYPTIEDMLAHRPDLDAVALCQPPQARFSAAHAALDAGKHVFLEKPPGASLSEVDALRALADRAKTTLFASWHSRFAAGVAPAKAWLAGRSPVSVKITWKEDVRYWHPGQTWIWEPGGLGVFDPGINALSILTELLAEPMRLLGADLAVPSNRQAPIAAELKLATLRGASVLAEFDFRQTGQQTWDIEIATKGETLTLRGGGAQLLIDGHSQPLEPVSEYASLYARFVQLITAGASEADTAPLQIVADAFMRGKIAPTAPFDD